MEIPSASRIVKWLVVVGLYFWVTGACVSVVLIPFGFSVSSLFDDYNFAQMVSGAFGLLSCILPLAIIAGLMALMAWIYNTDKMREQTASDDFKNNNLLFRYGYKINETTLPIAVKPEWTEQEIREFVEAMQNRIASQIHDRFAAAEVQVTNPIYIKDKDLPADNRNFLKVIFRSRRGSQASHFITYAITGKYVVVHYLSRIRGKYRWHDVADFVITGPISIWFWGISWLQNQYSVIAAISKIVSNSYDLLDLRTYFEASYLVLLDETRAFLDEKGLLTEAVNQIIVNNINNSQNVSISGSSGVSLGGVVNAVQSAAQSLGKQN